MEMVYSRIRKTGGKGTTDVTPGLVAIPLSDAKTVNVSLYFGYTQKTLKFGAHEIITVTVEIA